MRKHTRSSRVDPIPCLRVRGIGAEKIAALLNALTKQIAVLVLTTHMVLLDTVLTNENGRIYHRHVYLAVRS